MQFQDELFDSGPEITELVNGRLILYRTFLYDLGCEKLFNALRTKTKWEGGSIFIGGKYVEIPRLNAWYVDDSQTFTYSGIKLQPNSWFEELNEVRRLINSKLSIRFNSCLLNLYRNGSDSVAWHCDDEDELGRNPTIASLSLGAERKFILRSLHDHSERYTITLPNGSLLIMEGEVQHRYEHQVPKEKNISSPRINMTFRNIVN
ncbi:MAG: alpha-ketoglutarate-dependent dioxygenase AlkB [Lentisphaeraceae bacterium]|nr:alpha-ketoglutarate-dependent dioxygenase AlkB [Lentisphaeraceae bacterium]